MDTDTDMNMGMGMDMGTDVYTNAHILLKTPKWSAIAPLMGSCSLENILTAVSPVARAP